MVVISGELGKVSVKALSFSFYQKTRQSLLENHDGIFYSVVSLSHTIKSRSISDDIIRGTGQVE